MKWITRNGTKWHEKVQTNTDWLRAPIKEMSSFGEEHSKKCVFVVVFSNNMFMSSETIICAKP